MVTLTPGSVLLLCTDIVELYSLQRLWGSCAVVDFLFFFPPTPQGQGIWFGLSAVHHSHNRSSWTLNSRHSVYWPMLHTYCIHICTGWHLVFFFHCVCGQLQSTVDKLIKKTNLALVVGSSSWREQFVSAVTVSAGKWRHPGTFHVFISLWEAQGMEDLETWNCAKLSEDTFQML